MTTNYQSNSDKSKEPKSDKPDRQKVEKVISGEVVKRKKPLGQKFKELFISADAKSVFMYVCSDVLLPAARNMIVDASTKGIERMMYGDRAIQRRDYGTSSRYSYNRPVDRSALRSGGSSSSRQSSNMRQSREEVILSSRGEADLVIERMNDLIEAYGQASMADFNELVGFSSSHIDEKWGWRDIRDVEVRQIREGWLIDLPPQISI